MKPRNQEIDSVVSELQKKPIYEGPRARKAIKSNKGLSSTVLKPTYVADKKFGDAYGDDGKKVKPWTYDEDMTIINFLEETIMNTTCTN